jgi:hypothetical protein
VGPRQHYILERFGNLRHSVVLFEYLGSALLPVRMSWDGRDRISQWQTEYMYCGSRESYCRGMDKAVQASGRRSTRHAALGSTEGELAGVLYVAKSRLWLNDPFVTS